MVKVFIIKTKVAVAGGFDPLRKGHLRHIIRASHLGDYIYVLVSNTEDMIRKKGYEFMPMDERIEILEAIVKGLSIPGEVIATIDKDGTQAETLKMLKPDLLAKGGDRTPNNMPQNEIEACKEIGCRIIYGVGENITSSSELVERVISNTISKTKFMNVDGECKI